MTNTDCSHLPPGARWRATNRVQGASCVLAFAAAGLLHAAAPALKPAMSPADLQFFESKVRPLLAQNCYKCHSKEADKVKGGLMLDTREALIEGGNTGPAIVLGKPDESLLIQAIRYKDEDLQMPPKGEKLSDEQVAILTEWVRRGAPDPRTAAVAGTSGKSYGGVGKNHWAFQPVKKPALPSVQNPGWVKNPIDNFVLARLEANGMAPNKPADKATLIRRVYFDLIGLPPHPSEVINFVKDDSPDALARIVDKLLASPQYGEHWARYWLDVARYSDTKGDAKGQEDLRLPHAWTYRDWVIDAFNADLPYDKFILAQLAGDYLQQIIEKQAKGKKQTGPETRTMMAAQGFLTLGNQFNGRRDDIIGDQIDVTTKAFLGLTVACARCHDHKFDPIPTKDYYSLYGVFANSVQPTELPTLQIKVPQTSELLDYLAKSAELAKREQLVKQAEQSFRRGKAGKGKAVERGMSKEALMAALKLNPDSPRPIPQQIQALNRTLHREINDLETKHPGAPARANAVLDVHRVTANARSRDYPVLLRGEVGNRGEMVPRRFLEILSPDPKKRPEWHEGSGRWQLALAIADPKNPLTARVFVNRMWQQHWGVGFVETPDDLGNMSSAPTHPDLLDWLAATFVENRWSIKSLHRLIVLSNAYQQSSLNNPAYAEKDPNNKLLWRFNLRRMDFEALHDSLLAVTGELDRSRGGRPVAISSEQFAKRRAIYTLIDRLNPPEILTQFDFPSPDVASGRRYETIVPQQALFLMNSPMVIETARKLVDRPAFAELKNDEERVTLLYLAIYQRWPTKREVELGLRYVKSNPTGTDVALPTDAPPPKITGRVMAKKMAPKQQGRFNTQVGGVYENRTPLDAWTKLAHALFQSNEAMFYN
ncbi:MAG: PSD1 and planctomycete cytochrome C domain-containing protein [Opitutaceae bacterium]|nr:PSD1 and planctomycete cytochrome C domain-containing protein [Opitutaceae bacterium]